MFIWNEKEKCYYYADLNSLNGTILNGVLLKNKDKKSNFNAFKLNNLDVIRIDINSVNKSHPEAVTIIFSTSFDVSDIWQSVELTGSTKFSIGRDSSNDIVIDDVTISKKHAYLQWEQNDWYIYDNKSSNGVFINTDRIEDKQAIKNYDIFRISDTIFLNCNGKLVYNVTKKYGDEIHVDIDSKVVHKEGSLISNKKLLSDIHFTIANGEFVLILGGSGAGKTTLVNAILGVDKANGKIMLGNRDLYKNFEMLKHRIGFVPQHSASHLRMNDFTQNVIEDSARIKLPRDVSGKELKQRVANVMESLGLTKYKHQKISKLSGGQQKRVSVAVECISNPYLFILDEPDSGLDVVTGRVLMESLSQLSQTHKTVMVISHSSNNAQDLFTKVVVLAKSSADNAGHLAFYGSVNDACEFFKVKHLQDIIKRINPVEEGGDGLADSFIENFNRNRHLYE
jgi:ABC-type multidrug transport system ATPase subunit